MRRVARTIATTTASIALLAGCPSREVSKVDADRNKQERREIPVEVNRQIDILFVIDNSDSMAEEQLSMAQNFNRFIDVLQSIQGGLPDVRMAVVSTDLGANARIVNCDNGPGDDGAFQFEKREGCALPDDFLQGTFIEDTANPDGTRNKNYQGELKDAFSCIARLGTGGCGFEMPLESMKRGLMNNPGFLRDEAFLAVIFLADEDDCSTTDYGMFSTEDTDINSPLGPLDSFRCFEFGVECANDPNPRDLGTKNDCIPRKASQYMYDVDEYVAFLKGLKQDPSQVIVAGIIGDAEPVLVSTETAPTGDLKLTLEPSCMSDSGEAAPGVRLDYFIRQFGQRGTVTTICNEDLSNALTVIAQLLAKFIGSPCLEPGVDLDPETEGLQYDCQVSDQRFIGTTPVDGTEVPLKQCTSEAPDASEFPCWYLKANSETCADASQPHELVIARGEGAMPPAGTRAVVHCVVK